MSESTATGPVSPALREIATKLFWWKSADEALSHPIRFASQVMTLGTWDDVLTVRNELGDGLLREALRDAPAGVLDARSWNYWHLVFDMTPVPPLPKRSFVP